MAALKVLVAPRKRLPPPRMETDGQLLEAEKELRVLAIRTGEARLPLFLQRAVDKEMSHLSGERESFIRKPSPQAKSARGFAVCVRAVERGLVHLSTCLIPGP